MNTASRFSARRLLSASAVALVVAGGATACSADSDDDETAAAPVTVTVTPDAASPAATPAADAAASTTTLGATSAAPLITALDLARAKASGTPTDISVEADGSWSVTLEKKSGGETDVTVANGTATIVEEDVNDDGDELASAGSLGAADLRRAVAAALDASPGARVTGVDLETGMSAYAVDLLGSDGSEIETHLTDGFAIASSETESPDTDD